MGTSFWTLGDRIVSQLFFGFKGPSSESPGHHECICLHLVWLVHALYLYYPSEKVQIF